MKEKWALVFRLTDEGEKISDKPIEFKDPSVERILKMYKKKRE